MLPMLAYVPEREEAENFPVALRVLPRQFRQHLQAVYAVARMIDDIGDEAEGDRTALLMAFRSELASVWTGAPEHPVLVRLVPTVRACGLDQRPFQDLVDANLVDQERDHYDTFEDLLDYCRLSAVPIGRLVLAIFGQSDDVTCRLSDDICIALQLLEHWQDVGEDYRRGRTYVPQRDLREFGVRDPDLEAPAAAEPLRNLIRFETERARALLDRGRPLLGRLQGWAQVAVAGYLAGGYATVAAIRRSGYDVLGRNTQPRRRDVAADLARLLLRSQPEVV